MMCKIVLRKIPFLGYKIMINTLFLCAFFSHGFYPFSFSVIDVTFSFHQKWVDSFSLLFFCLFPFPSIPVQSLFLSFGMSPLFVR